MTHENRLMALMEIIVIPDNGSWKGTLEELETLFWKIPRTKDKLRSYFTIQRLL